MSKLNPKNREEAFAWQLQDCASVLMACAHSGQKSFEKQLQVIETYINTYRILSKNKGKR